MDIIPVYSKETALEAVVQVVRFSKERNERRPCGKHTPEVTRFIDQHPWAMKWLNFTTEADWLMKICLGPDVEIAESPWPNELQKYREEKNMPKQIRFAVRAESVADVYGNEKVFSFQDCGDGQYVFYK